MPSIVVENLTIDIPVLSIRARSLRTIAVAKARAIGGKITGAGGGGFLLLFCPQRYQQNVREGITALGAKEMGFEFDFQGAQVVADDPFIDGDENGGMRWTFAPVADKPKSRTSTKSSV